MKEQEQIDVAVCPPLQKRLFYNCPPGGAVKEMGQIKRNKNALPSVDQPSCPSFFLLIHGCNHEFCIDCSNFILLVCNHISVKPQKPEFYLCF